MYNMNEAISEHEEIISSLSTFETISYLLILLIILSSTQYYNNLYYY